MSLRLIASIGLLLATSILTGVGTGVAFAHIQAALTGGEATMMLRTVWSLSMAILTFGGMVDIIYNEYDE